MVRKNPTTTTSLPKNIPAMPSWFWLANHYHKSNDTTTAVSLQLRWWLWLCSCHFDSKNAAKLISTKTSILLEEHHSNLYLVRDLIICIKIALIILTFLGVTTLCTSTALASSSVVQILDWNETPPSHFNSKSNPLKSSCNFISSMQSHWGHTRKFDRIFRFLFSAGMVSKKVITHPIGHQSWQNKGLQIQLAISWSILICFLIRIEL